MGEQNDNVVDRAEEGTDDFEGHVLEDGSVVDQAIDKDKPDAEDDFEGHVLEVGQVSDAFTDQVAD